MRIFKELSIKQLFIAADKNIIKEIQGLPEQKLLESDLDALANEIAKKNRINTELSISTENVTTEIKMEPIPKMSKYFVATVRYGFPVKGNVELFKYQPLKQSRIGEIRGELTNKGLLTIIIGTRWSTPDLDEKTEKSVTAQITSQIEDINSNIERVKEEVQTFNDSLFDGILPILTNLKSEIVEKNKRRDRLNPFK